MASREGQRYCVVSSEGQRDIVWYLGRVREILCGI